MTRLWLACAISLLGANAVAADNAADTNPSDKDSINVTIVGTLRTGIAAIGGETTGTTITSKGITWELDFGKNAKSRKSAKKLHGEKVLVKGSLERRKGIEIKERWIVTATSLRAVDAGSVDAGEGPRFHATVGRTDTRIQFAEKPDQTVIDVSSGFGIDRVTIERKSKTWPKRVLVRLHLRGLESFRVGVDDVAVEWFVSSTGDHASRVSLRTGNEETQLDSGDPYHTDARIIGGNGTIPLKGGYFEVPLPRKLFQENPEEITLRWIDFYRS